MLIPESMCIYRPLVPLNFPKQGKVAPHKFAEVWTQDWGQMTQVDKIQKKKTIKNKMKVIEGGNTGIIIWWSWMTKHLLVLLITNY